VRLLDLLDLLPLTVLGAVLGLDTVSFPQAMVSRPIVAATLAGALIGHAPGGLVAGIILELIALETLPFGASRYPEWGSASVVGGAMYAAAPNGAHGALAAAVLTALGIAWLGGSSMVWLRRLNARWARNKLAGLERGSRGTVVGLQLAGLTADLVRGGLLTFIALALTRTLGAQAVRLWSVDGRLTRAIVVGIAATVAAGAVWKIFHTTSAARWYMLAGLGLGFAILALR
jgi:PTS system mannose-specific IIC component